MWIRIIKVGIPKTRPAENPGALYTPASDEIIHLRFSSIERCHKQGMAGLCEHSFMYNNEDCIVGNRLLPNYNVKYLSEMHTRIANARIGAKVDKSASVADL